MTDPRQGGRRFTIADGMALVAATAAGIAVAGPGLAGFLALAVGFARDLEVGGELRDGHLDDRVALHRRLWTLALPLLQDQVGARALEEGRSPTRDRGLPLGLAFAADGRRDDPRGQIYQLVGGKGSGIASKGSRRASPLAMEAGLGGRHPR